MLNVPCIPPGPLAPDAFVLLRDIRRNMKIPPPLLDDISAGKCLPFVGAGFSLNAKLPENNRMPDWPGLTRILAAHLISTAAKQGSPKVASDYERNFGRVQLIEAIRKALHTGVAEPGKAHIAFAQLPFDTVYTTNFDLLLEEANAILRRPYRSLVGELQMPFHGGPMSTTIVKMHGDLRHEEHIIVTKEDYDGYLQKYPVISTHLSAMLITKTALFIGYSLSDPDFNHIRDIVRSRLGRFQRMSYVVQFNRSETKIKTMLDDHLHVLNFHVKHGEAIDDVLADFFGMIQRALDLRAGKRLRATRPDVFEEVPEGSIEAASKAPDASTLLGSSSNLCFVLMPFGEPFDLTYRNVIQPAISASGLEPMRADQLFPLDSIMEQIRAAIQQSRLCIADVTGRNPSVLYEIGIAHTLMKPIILLAQDFHDIPFDLRQFDVIVYDKGTGGRVVAREALRKSIEGALGLGGLAEAHRLLDNGAFRAAAAVTGVLLEHVLWQVIQRHELCFVEGRSQSVKTLGSGGMLVMLARAGLINDNEIPALREALRIRNKAVHDLAEPTVQEAKHLFTTVEQFIRRHLDETERESQ